jgi:type I restriction enzyme S subunit
MTESWPKIRLDKLLRPICRRESVNPSTIYNILGAHWYAEGLYIKEIKPGREIAASYLYKIKKGDFVYNRLFAWKGSFAIATSENDNCYASNEFPCFEIAEERLNPQYLHYYFSRKSVWNEAFGLSTGGTPTSRNRLKEQRLLEMEIPLPSLDEQFHIVVRINELANKVKETEIIRHQMIKELTAFFISYQRKIFTPESDWYGYSLEDCCENIIDYRGRTPPISETGIPHLTSSNIRGGCIDWKTNKFVTEDIYASFMTRGLPRSGDIIFTMEAPLGQTAIVPDNRKFSLAQRTLLLRPKKDIIDSRYFAWYLMSPAVHELILSKATGTTVKGIASKRLKTIQLNIPSIEIQRRIAENIDLINQKINELLDIQYENLENLKAIIPSMLENTFKGKL